MKNEHFIPAIHNFNSTSNVILLEPATPYLYLNRPCPSLSLFIFLITVSNSVAVSSFVIFKNSFEIIPLEVSGKFSDRIWNDSDLIDRNFSTFIWKLLKAQNLLNFGIRLFKWTWSIMNWSIHNEFLF